MVPHTFSPSTRRVGRDGDLCELEASLIYIVGFWTARVTKRNPVSKKQKTKKKNTQHQITKEKQFQIMEHSGSGCSPTLYELSTTHVPYGVLQEAHRDAPGGDPH